MISKLFISVSIWWKYDIMVYYRTSLLNSAFSHATLVASIWPWWEYFSSVQSLRLFPAPQTAACQSSLSFTISQNLLKFTCIESVMPSSHLILCCPLFLPPSIFPSIRVFSNELALLIRWPKYWSFGICYKLRYSSPIPPPPRTSC